MVAKRNNGHKNIMISENFKRKEGVALLFKAGNTSLPHCSPNSVPFVPPETSSCMGQPILCKTVQVFDLKGDQ